MLELAFHHKEELNRHYANMMLNSAKYKYVLARNWISYKLNIEDNSWNKIQLVSVTHDPYRLHGYFKCDVNRVVHYAYSFIVINFDDKPSLIFANDFKKFLQTSCRECFSTWMNLYTNKKHSSRRYNYGN